MRPSSILIVGGPAAVSPAVEDALRALAPSVGRFAGADVFATAASVAVDGVGSLAPPARGSVFVVNPDDTSSGVSAGWLAAARGVPVLLTAPGGLPQATADALARLHPSTTYVVGGVSAVSDAVVASLPGGRRVAEADPYGTSIAVADLGAGWGVNVRHAVLASGWADAVSAAPLAGVFNAPLLLTDPRVWHPRLADWYRGRSPTGTTIVGGEGAVNAFVAATAADGGEGTTRTLGSAGAVVGLIQQRLRDIGFNPGTPNGRFDAHTRFAVWTLQKAFGLPLTGNVGDAELFRLREGQRPPVLRPDITAQYGDHVEISLARQLVQIVRRGQVEWSVHTSTGKPSTPTVQGLFHILDHRPGFNADHMYMTMHFYKAYAIHGYDPVPPYAASHGCARVSYPDAELLYAAIPNGMPVIVWR
jgi:peptidoglycan hydrolase-like protein with peptidoglycan-binding domain